MRNNESGERQADTLGMLKVLASPVRLAVLEYLKDPVTNFPPQVDGDLVLDGVCADFLRDRLGIAAATASRHLTLLADSGLVIATRKKGWTFYRRDEAAIAHFTALLQTGL
ncbi:DNA-binding transcriptional ArsR family regulator [Sphingomonas sp. UYAg733]